MERFFELYDEALAVSKSMFQNKSKLYLNGDSIIDYWVHGESDLVYEINKKALRMVRAEKSGMLDKSSELAADNLIDSALDMINYAAFLYAFLKWKKEKERQ